MRKLELCLLLIALGLSTIFTRIPTVRAESYINTWTWSGHTAEVVDTAVYNVKDIEPTPSDPFPTNDVKTASEIAILAETTAKFQEQMSTIGITTTVIKIEPNVWIETIQEVHVKPGNMWDYYDYIWHHRLYMSATVTFTSDKPILHSPIDPATLAVFAIIVKYLIGVTAVALVVYGIAITFINSFFVTTHIVETYDQNGNLIKKEYIRNPSIGGLDQWTIVLIIVLVIAGVLLYYKLPAYKPSKSKPSKSK